MPDLLGDDPPADLVIVARLSRSEREALLAAVRAVLGEAPLFTPAMPRTGTPFSVRMSNCGPLGWVSDARGYRYQPTHPQTGAPWPAIPAAIRAVWDRYGGYPHPPEACLVNWYESGARMGLHQDRDERDLDAPVLSISLGDSCRFRIGGARRDAPTRSFVLACGDVLRLAGATRLAFHGVDRILPGTGDLLDRPGRINLTLRRVIRPS